MVAGAVCGRAFVVADISHPQRSATIVNAGVTNATGPAAKSPLLHEELIDVAPKPVFSGLERFDDRVIRRVEVLGRVLVLGTVAAADMAACLAEAKVNPRIAHFQALFTTLGGWRDLVNLAQVRTCCSSH